MCRYGIGFELVSVWTLPKGAPFGDSLSLIAWRSGAREEFELKDDWEAVAALSSQLADCVNLSAKAAGLRPVLDFEFLSRPAPPCN
jgi:hypothetical protein